MPFKILCLICAFFVLCPLAFAQEELPFWQKKIRLYKKILNDRKIVVSVKKEELNGIKKFRVVGAGTVNSPLDECFLDVQNFEDLTKVSSYFKVARQDKKNQLVYLRIEAFGYTAKMFMKYRITLDNEKEKQLDFQVIKGTFKGMVGHYNFKKVSNEQTEISMWSFFQGEKLPIPDFFLKFTLEVISEKVAQKMRSYLEETHRARQKKASAAEIKKTSGQKGKGVH